MKSEAVRYEKKNYRKIIGTLSVLISIIFLISEIEPFINQLANPNTLWFYRILPELHAPGWIIATILLISGMLLVFNKRHAQLFYHLFGISIISENVIRIINYDVGIFYSYILILPIGLGVFSIYISKSSKWKERLNWSTQIEKRIWIANILIAILIVSIPRFLFKGWCYL